MVYEGSQGSCKNPYGGISNPSRVDFTEWLANPECLNGGCCSGAKLLALTQIAHTCSDYLFYGLGRNGYTLDKWFEAVEFFWRTRSNNPETWKDAPKIKYTKLGDNGKQEVYFETPPEETLKLQCFDKYYELADLGNVMSITVFLECLKKERRKLIYKNKQQVEEYFHFCRTNQVLSNIGQMSFLIDYSDFLEVLIWPESPEQIGKRLLPVIFNAVSEVHKERKRLRRASRQKNDIINKQQSFVL